MKTKIVISSVLLILLSLAIRYSFGNSHNNSIREVDIPDLPGMTIKGLVYCDGVGVPNVVVSDGYEVAITDDNGIYYLPSKKKHGYVFISVPGNYEVVNDKNVPQIFSRVVDPTSVDRRDFSLTRVDNRNHIVIAMADLHLANENEDLFQFTNNFLPDINSVISNYQGKGIKVYGLTLGDLSYDRYWYANNFGLPEYLPYMNKIDCPVFNVMGNHDNNPYCEGDWFAESTYKNIVGPTYYSFNLGSVHYIVLDDIEYQNKGGALGTIGKRNYNGVIVSGQMEWLKKDLETIQDKNTPIIIAMHIPLHGYPTLDGDSRKIKNNVTLDNGNELLSVVNDFSNVHILSGHKHVNYSVEATSGLMEHNIAAVCATWWRTGKTGFANNHICIDGSPGGYSIWEIDDKDLQWYYKGIGCERDYQFRSYDLNMIQITNEEYAPNATVHPSEYAGGYANSQKNNEVLINLWGFDSKWKISVKENNKPLNVSRVMAHDPLSIISNLTIFYDKDLVPYKKPYNVSNMFKVTASSPTSTLEIKVTDRFGNVYRETMVRPKDFSYLMK